MNLSTEQQPSSNKVPSATATVVVGNKMGIHARPAAMIVRIANKYSDTELYVTKGDHTINAKSIMGLMMLAAGSGTKLLLEAYGAQGHAVIAELEELFARHFEEN